MTLLFPQWQGSGYSERARLRIGAQVWAGLVPPETEVLRVSGDAGPLASGVRAWAELTEQAHRARNLIAERQPERVVTFGGDCGVALVPAGYLNAQHSDLALLWLDAHADLNTPESSPSGAFHGMVLRALLGEGDAKLINYAEKPFMPEQVFLLGARDLDPPEQARANAARLKHFKAAELSRRPETLKDALELRGFKKLYLHFDLDALDPSEDVPTCYPTPGGFRLAEVSRLLETLNKAFELVGLSVTEYAPPDEDPGPAAKVLELLESYL